MAIVSIIIVFLLCCVFVCGFSKSWAIFCGAKYENQYFIPWAEVGVDKEITKFLGEEEDEICHRFFFYFFEEERFMFISWFVIAVITVSAIIGLC